MIVISFMRYLRGLGVGEEMIEASWCRYMRTELYACLCEMPPIAVTRVWRNANLGLYSGCKGEEGAPSKAGYGHFMTV
jgi:hypothetical protein